MDLGEILGVQKYPLIDLFHFLIFLQIDSLFLYKSIFRCYFHWLKLIPSQWVVFQNFHIELIIGLLWTQHSQTIINVLKFILRFLDSNFTQFSHESEISSHSIGKSSRIQQFWRIILNIDFVQFFIPLLYFNQKLIWVLEFNLILSLKVISIIFKLIIGELRV